jgi:hypothetical protein
VIVAAWEFVAIALLVIGVLALFDAPPVERETPEIREFRRHCVERARARHYAQQVKGT